MDENDKKGKEAALLAMLIESHQVAITKSSLNYPTNHKTKGWGKLDPIAQRIFLTTGCDGNNYRKGPPKIPNQELEAHTGAQMR